ncbi:MAG: ABC transporter permease [Candidatus Acidiferrales bacterium]
MSWMKFFRRDEWDAERAREMEAHLDHEADEGVARGMSREEARFAAKRKLGNETRVREEIYEMNTLGFIETLWQDVRYAVRMLRKSPGYAAVAIFTLALGIGANTTVFSVINTVLLRPLPFPRADRLALLWKVDIHDAKGTNVLSAPDFHDWQRDTDAFESMAIFDSGGTGYNLSESGGEPERVSGLRVSSQFFDVLGVKPMLGRGFLPEEEVAGRDHEVVLSYPLWTRRYKRDPGIVGKTIRVDGESYTVVGVMPREFEFQFWSNLRELWVPVGYTAIDMERGENSFVCIARLKDGVSFARADAEMHALGDRLRKAYPADLANMSATAQPLAEFGLEDLRATMLALSVAVCFVLLIVCVNVANLTLGRSAVRQKEIAVRRTLGAGRGRIIRQLLTESVILALAGGLAGLAVAEIGLRVLESAMPEALVFLSFRHVASIAMNGRVYLFAFGVSCLAGVLFGFAPAFSAERGDLNATLKEGGRNATQAKGNRLRQVLVATEIALAMVVLSGAALMVVSVARLLNVPTGFEARHVLTMDLSTPEVSGIGSVARNPNFCRQIADSVGTLPGVVAVGATSGLPFEGWAGRGITVEGRPDPGPEHTEGSRYNTVCPGYFAALSVPVLDGRDFNLNDVDGATPVVVVNETFAKRFWPNQSAVGHHFKPGQFNSDAGWFTIVGVVRDTRHWALDQRVWPEFYRPFMQSAWPTMSLAVKTEAAPMGMAPAVERAMAGTLRDTPVTNVQPLEQIVADSVSGRTFPMELLACFAVVALVLAAVGIAGVVSYAVTQRTREIGIRMAFGASARDVLRMIVGGSMRWVVIGVVVGVVASLAATRLLEVLLFDVRAGDPRVLGAMAAVLAVVAFAASYLPARRATRVDPMVALRYE